MSLKTWLMPAISQHLLSRERLDKARLKAERRRQASGQGHQVHYFHQVDDPYSALVGAVLPELVARYDIELVPHVVGPPPDSAAPEREKLVAYSRHDAERLARHWHLPFVDPGIQPDADSARTATVLLVDAIRRGRFVEEAADLCARLWATPELAGKTVDEPARAAAASQVREADALRERLGHYLGGMFFYGGEWYWGIDRLHHLERRLQDLGAQSPGVQGALFPPVADLTEPVQLDDPQTIDFHFSLRSPYSAIVAPRVFELARLAGATVRLRYVLPMVMRGLPVPRAKRAYISQDAAREAFLRGVPFGRVNDPVGRPAERGLALITLAQRAGRAEAYVLSFLRGVWAEGIDAGSDRGLRTIVERAGLSWAEAREALKDEAWRLTAEKNREELFALGLWGVPSFRVGDTAVWGQDRLWAVRDALLERARPAPAANQAP